MHFIMQSQSVSREACPRCKSRGSETFYYMGGKYLFDVDKAAVICRDGREPVEVEDDSIREAIEDGTIDDFHLDHVDPTIPGIIAQIFHEHEGETIQAHLLIDGHHRGARAMRDGLVFSCYLLDEKESKDI